METSRTERDRKVAELVKAIEKNGFEMQKAWERAKNLNAAIESAKQSHRKIKAKKP
jgi:hypothetical protein